MQKNASVKRMREDRSDPPEAPPLKRQKAVDITRADSDGDILMTTPNEEELLYREFINRQAPTEGRFVFRIANWNLLADGLSGIYEDPTSPKVFAHLPRKYLEASYRVPLMIEEIRRMNPDVICFEEYDLYKEPSFVLGLQELGFTVGGNKNKRWSPCINIGTGLSPDGVAVFFKKDVFEENPMVSYTDQERHKIWLLEAIDGNPIDENGCVSVIAIVESKAEKDRARLYEVIDDEAKQGNIDDPEFLSRDRTTKLIKVDKLRAWCQSMVPPPSVAVRLIPKAHPNQPLCVIATHLVSTKKESGERQRLMEMQALLQHPNHQETRRDAHVFLSCDMNATCSDAMGYPPLTYSWLMEKGNDKNVFFRSAMNIDGNELEYTSWKKRVKNGVEKELKYTVDFVFYPDTDAWKVLDVFSIPSTDACRESVASMVEENPELKGEPAPLPGKHYPSDHLAICATMEFAG